MRKLAERLMGLRTRYVVLLLWGRRVIGLRLVTRWQLNSFTLGTGEGERGGVRGVGRRLHYISPKKVIKLKSIIIIIES